MALDLASLTLTVSDALDGANATASLTGAGAGASVALLRAAWNPEAGGRASWAQVATATANGSGVASFGSVSTTPGFYLWQGVQMPTASTADALSGVVFRPVIDPTETVHVRVLDAVVTMIRSLNLTGIGSAANKVFRRWFPVYLTSHDQAATALGVGSGGGLPQIQVSPYPREQPMDVMSNRDDVGYPILVAFFDTANQTLDNNVPRNLKWRRQVAALFRAQQLSGVPEVVTTLWQPEAVVDVQGLHQNYLVGALTLTFRSRETRGLVA